MIWETVWHCNDEISTWFHNPFQFCTDGSWIGHMLKHVAAHESPIATNPEVIHKIVVRQITAEIYPIALLDIEMIDSHASFAKGRKDFLIDPWLNLLTECCGGTPNIQDRRQVR